jgi:hypothetical protein
LNIQKLKIEKFQNIKLVNFPAEIDLGLKSSDEKAEVILYYINKESDIQKFVDLCQVHDLPEDNRTIMIFKKGRKDGVNRDTIILPFKNKVYTGFKFKAPMLCSLSDELSAFVLFKEI